MHEDEPLACLAGAMCNSWDDLRNSASWIRHWHCESKWNSVCEINQLHDVKSAHFKKISLSILNGEEWSEQTIAVFSACQTSFGICFNDSLEYQDLSTNSLSYSLVTGHHLNWLGRN